MGSYGEDVCLDCSWCGKWEGSISHTDVDGIGLLCLRCKHFGPPHFEYLLGLLKDHLPERLVIKIAAFAYDEDDFECEFCDESWIGWHCQYCLKIS